MVKYVLVFWSALFWHLQVKAQDADASGKKIVPELSLPKRIEFSPTISADGKTMIFESSVDDDKGWELFESQLNDGKWTEPVPLKTINEKCQFIAGPAISYDGNTLYYTAFIEGTSQSEDIYYSVRTSNKTWSEPLRMEAPINTDENYEGFPSISPDGMDLYFIRQNDENPVDRKSKEPCFKIYVSRKSKDGKWGEPQLLPAPINQACERDPKIMADNHTLIFSSIRANSRGKYDMLQTTKQNDGSWSSPVTLDFVNSEDNDQSPCISAAGDVMFYYSGGDIFSVPIPETYRQMINVVFEGTVLDAATLKPLQLSIEVTDESQHTSYLQSSSPVDGSFSLTLTTGNRYKILFDQEAYLPDSTLLDLTDQKSFNIIRKNILLKNTYEAQVDLIDKDLGKKVDAYVEIYNHARNIIRDTLRIDQLPLTKIFDNDDYTLTAKKAKYYSVTDKLEFKKIRRQKSKDLVIRIEHEKIKFKVHTVNSKDKSSTVVKLYYKNKDESELLLAQSGEEVLLRKGDRYQIVTQSQEGYFFTSADIVAGEQESIELILVPIEMNASLTLNNITFETNSAELKQSSQFELDRIVELMQVNPGLTVEVSAHTDDMGDDDFNLKLSNKRAQAALDYLIKKGVDKSRLVPVGYGESKPIAANETEEGRSLNRRVELKVLKVS